MPNILKNVKASVKDKLQKHGRKSHRDHPSMSQLSLGSSAGSSSISDALRRMGSIATTPSMSTADTDETGHTDDVDPADKIESKDVKDPEVKNLRGDNPREPLQPGDAARVSAPSLDNVDEAGLIDSVGSVEVVVPGTTEVSRAIDIDNLRVKGKAPQASGPSTKNADVDAGRADPVDVVEASKVTGIIRPLRVRPLAEQAPQVHSPGLYSNLSPEARLAKQRSIASTLFQPHILSTILFYTRLRPNINWEVLHSEGYWSRMDPDPLLGANSPWLITSYVFVNRAFREACTSMEYHTLEIMTLEALHRALKFFRDPTHAHLRVHVKVLNIYSVNFTYFGEWVKPGEIRELHKLIPPSEVPKLFPNVHTVNLMDYARIDPAFLSALPKLRVLRTNQNALPHPGKDVEWPRTPLHLTELSILYARSWKGVWPDRHRMEGPTRRGGLYETKYLDLTNGWLRTPGVLTGIRKLTFNAPRLWGLLDMARIIKFCPVLEDLQCEMHAFIELWDNPHPAHLERPLPWTKFESNSVTSLHVHFHAPGDAGEWAFLLPELLGRSSLPALRALRLSFLDRLEADASTRSIDTYTSTRGQAALALVTTGDAIPAHVTASVDTLEIDVARPSAYYVEKHGGVLDSEGLLGRQRQAIERVVKFMHFGGRSECVKVMVREECEWKGLPTDLQDDDREAVQ